MKKKLNYLYLFIGLIIGSMCFISCSDDDDVQSSIIGRWEMRETIDDEDLFFSIAFDEDGYFFYETHVGREVDFGLGEYIVKKNKVIMDFYTSYDDETIDYTEILTFTIKDGKTLYLINEDGEKLGPLTKAK